MVKPVLPEGIWKDTFQALLNSVYEEGNFESVETAVPKMAIKNARRLPGFRMSMRKSPSFAAEWSDDDSRVKCSVCKAATKDYWLCKSCELTFTACASCEESQREHEHLMLRIQEE